MADDLAFVGYCTAHVLDDDGRIEFLEQEWGQVPTYPTVSEAQRARGGGHPDTWQVVEVRIVAEEVQ